MTLTQCDVCHRILSQDDPRYSVSISAIGRTRRAGQLLDICDACYGDVRKTLARVSRIRMKGASDAD